MKWGNNSRLKSKSQGGMAIFHTSTLKAVIEQYSFTGVRFDSDLINPF